MGKIKSKGAVVVCLIAIILIILLLVVKGGNKEPVQNDMNNNLAIQNEGNNLTEQYVKKNEDGTKENISEQLKTTKTVAGLELTNIKLIENAGLTKLTADAKNITNSTIEELDIIVIAIDKNGNTLAEFEASVYGVGAGQTTQLNAAITADIANAYDFTVRKK